MKKIGLYLILLLCLPHVLAAQSELPLPAVPDSLRTPTERASYIMNHFWDTMDWQDSALVADDRFMEQNSANFYSLFPHTDSISGSRAVAGMLEGARVSDKAYRRVADIAKLYLYDPVSPMVNDETYAIVIDRLLADKVLPQAELLRLEDIHNYLMMNRVGYKASDLSLVTRDGTELMLSELADRSRQTMLMFYDPDCHDCAELENYLIQNPEFAGQFKIVMVCPYEVDTDQWLSHASTMPDTWVVARPATEDFEIDEIYEIRATPSVYILTPTLHISAKNITLRELINTR